MQKTGRFHVGRLNGLTFTGDTTINVLHRVTEDLFVAVFYEFGIKEITLK
ncbi:hypothetical protein [Flavobacterium sp. XS2P39]